MEAGFSGSDSPEGVSFLTALLVRFPELGSARLREGSRYIHLDFYLQESIEDEAFEAFCEYAGLAWEVFFDLQRIDPGLVTVERTEANQSELPIPEDGHDGGSTTADSIQVVRDMASLTVEELSLVVTLVRERFEDVLAINEEMPAEDAAYQEEMIHRSLEQLRMGSGEGTLTGFRDDMRVLIYASQEKE